MFLGNGSTIIQYDPITLSSTGNHICARTALFINDTWRFDNGVTLNLGLRWDRNDGDGCRR